MSDSNHKLSRSKTSSDPEINTVQLRKLSSSNSGSSSNSRRSSYIGRSMASIAEDFTEPIEEAQEPTSDDLDENASQIKGLETISERSEPFSIAVLAHEKVAASPFGLEVSKNAEIPKELESAIAKDESIANDEARIQEAINELPLRSNNRLDSRLRSNNRLNDAPSKSADQLSPDNNIVIARLKKETSNRCSFKLDQQGSKQEKITFNMQKSRSSDMFTKRVSMQSIKAQQVTESDNAGGESNISTEPYVSGLMGGDERRKSSRMSGIGFNAGADGKPQANRSSITGTRKSWIHQEKRLSFLAQQAGSQYPQRQSWLSKAEKRQSSQSMKYKLSTSNTSILKETPDVFKSGDLISNSRDIMLTDQKVNLILSDQAHLNNHSARSLGLSEHPHKSITFAEAEAGHSVKDLYIINGNEEKLKNQDLQNLQDATSPVQQLLDFNSHTSPTNENFKVVSVPDLFEFKGPEDIPAAEEIPAIAVSLRNSMTRQSSVARRIRSSSFGVKKRPSFLRPSVNERTSTSVSKPVPPNNIEEMSKQISDEAILAEKDRPIISLYPRKSISSTHTSIRGEFRSRRNSTSISIRSKSSGLSVNRINPEEMLEKIASIENSVISSLASNASLENTNLFPQLAVLSEQPRVSTTKSVKDKAAREYDDYLAFQQRHDSSNFIQRVASNEIVYEAPSISIKMLGPHLMGGKIGKGAFGKVKEGLCTDTLERIAVKIIAKNRVKKIIGTVIREIKLLQRLKHPNVVRLVDVFAKVEDEEGKVGIFPWFLTIEEEPIIWIFEDGSEEEKDVKILKWYIVMEFCPCSLQTILDTSVDNKLTIEESHSQKVVHRDIKPGNLLVTTDGSIKITDFGIAEQFDIFSNSTMYCVNFSGTHQFLPPEVLSDESDTGYDGTKVDIWSCGVVLYNMISGFLPFEFNSEANLISLHEKIIEGVFEMPREATNTCDDLIERILEVDPEKRFSVHQILQHPWSISEFLAKRKNTGSFYTYQHSKEDVNQEGEEAEEVLIPVETTMIAFLNQLYLKELEGDIAQSGLITDMINQEEEVFARENTKGKKSSMKNWIIKQLSVKK